MKTKAIQIIRWIILLPVSVFIALLVSYFILVLFMVPLNYSGYPWLFEYFDMLSYFVTGFVFIYLAFFIAPCYKHLTVVVLFVILLALWIVNTIVPNPFYWYAFISLLSIVLGAFLATILIFIFNKKPSAIGVNSMIEIIEHYKDYEPPKAVLKSLKRLIRYTDKKYLVGISYVELTNTAALNRELRREKTKSRKKSGFLHDSLGWYCEKWKDEPAYIVLLTDHIFSSNLSKWRLYFNFPVDARLSMTFFHELGHHIHKTKIPEYRETENVADDWKFRLYFQFVKMRYWYLLLLLKPIGYFYAFLFVKRKEK